jgi:hypothetical protein
MGEVQIVRGWKNSKRPLSILNERWKKKAVFNQYLGNKIT